MFNRLVKFRLFTCDNVDQHCKNSPDNGTVSEKKRFINSGLIYGLILILYFIFTWNAYLTWQWEAQISQHASQIQALTAKVDQLSLSVNHLYVKTKNLATNQPISRSKRNKNEPPHSTVSDPWHGDLKHAYRWVESDKPRQRNCSRKRHVDSVPNENDARHINDGQPGVEIFTHPQETDRQTPGFKWMTSYSRVSLQVLEEFCYSSRKHCLRGDPGPPGLTGEKGSKGDQGVPGEPGVRGYPGQRGLPGNKGEPGLDGIDGLPGEPGLEGTPGRDGNDGKPGLPGNPGFNGVPGKDGTDGIPGTKGESGHNGIPGSPGPRGRRGPPGPEGKPGVMVTAWKYQNSTLLIAPSIDDMSDTFHNVTVKENENVRLLCVASGQPKPKITWRREDGRAILVDGTSYNMIESAQINISHVSRDNMGPYTCVATNGIPPAARKRINLIVTFPPLVKILLPRQMIGTVKNSWVVLECYIEGYPEPFVDWVYGESLVLVESKKYRKHEKVLQTSLSHVVSKRVFLNITKVESEDFGLYKCVAHNHRGQTYGIITLYESDFKIAPNESSLREASFVTYGEVPKHSQKKAHCEPCPDCTSSIYSTQCKEGTRKAIVNVGVSVLFNNTSWHPLSKQNSQCYLSQIGKPVFYGDYDNTEVGCWMRDPSPIKAEDEEKYWVTRVHDNQLLEEFGSKENFRNRLVTRNYTLLHRFGGNAQAIYGGSFYYAEEGTNKLVIFNLDTLESAFLNLEPSASSMRANFAPRSKPYRHVRRGHHLRRRREHGDVSAKRKLLYSNQLNQMDIAVDENGVWVVYPNIYSDTNNTIVMKFNATRIEFIWNLTVDYHTTGDTFIVCGVLYGVDSVTQLTTHISFAYDLYENVELKHLEQVKFTNPFMATQYIGYNPRHQKLYTWDKGNILEYPLKIDSKLATTEENGDD